MRLDATNPMNASMRALLVFEAVILWLAFPGMVQVDGVATGTAVTACLAVTIILLAATGGITRTWGYPLSWLGQIGFVALGVLTPWMYAMGIIFLVLWVTSFVLGRRIEAKRSADG